MRARKYRYNRNMQLLPSLKEVKAKPSRIREIPVTHANYMSYLRDLAKEGTSMPVLVKEYHRHLEQKKEIVGHALEVFSENGIMLKIPYPENIALRKEYLINQLRILTLADYMSNEFIDDKSVELNRVLNQWVKDQPEQKDTIFQEYTAIFLNSLKVYDTINSMPSLEKTIAKHERNAYVLRKTLPVSLRTYANLVTLAEKIPGGLQVNPHHLGECDTLRLVQTPDLPWLYGVLQNSWPKWFPQSLAAKDLTAQLSAMNALQCWDINVLNMPDVPSHDVGRLLDPFSGGVHG